MNIGPMGDGRMAPEDIAILQGIGRWWKLNGESIRGTTRTPLPIQTWGESTRKGNTLHVFDWPKDGKLVVGGLKSNIKSSKLLAAGSEVVVRRKPQLLPLPKGEGRGEGEGTARQPNASEPTSRVHQPVVHGEGSFLISRLNTDDSTITGLPPIPPDKTDTVIALDCDEPIITDSIRLLQPSYPTETLRVLDAKLHGKGLKFGAGKTRDAYAYEWTREDQFISWSTRLNQDASYQVELIYDAEPASASGTYAISFGTEVLKGTVKAGTMQTVSLGHVSLKAGTLEIKLSADEIKGGELMRPRCLVLK
jgi:alpha-L-fucosidase